VNIPTFHIVWTILLMILFIGIVVWAWGARRKRSFEQAAHMLLEDDDDGVPRS
jgi:cytochrome c oxidase cbb3-type subunit IV